MVLTWLYYEEISDKIRISKRGLCEFANKKCPETGNEKATGKICKRSEEYFGK